MRADMVFDFAVIGGGIVGLSTARALYRRYPDARLVVLEKEGDWALHQSGRNSGVIHSGIYYRPGSLKARLARRGNRSMVEFCDRHAIPYKICGKVIVAARGEELPLLEGLHRRGLENGLEVSRISAEEVRDIEPHVCCLAGIRVPSAGLVDYRQVCLKLALEVEEAGGELRLGAAVERLLGGKRTRILETSRGPFETRFVINCAGLHSDRLARLAGVALETRIVPFRGEYYELRPEKRCLVNTLVYSIPDPRLPFLGTHFMRKIDGTAYVGPNAVVSLKREGYRKTDFDLRDCLETLCYPGFWRFVAAHRHEAADQLIRSFSKRAFVRALQRVVPEIQRADLVPGRAGVRAQALGGDGRLIDDFLTVHEPNAVHVCNAPSPAATASLEIGEAIARLAHLQSV